MFITFRDIWMSKPETFQDTAMVKLGASAQVLGTAGGLFGSGANLTNLLSGRSQTAQGSQATTLISQGVQLTTGVTQTANMINSSGQVMKAAKARLVSLVTAARTAAFLVDLNTGIVKPNPGMLSGVHASAFIAQAAVFNENIQTVVFQVNAHDIAVKLSLAKTALDVVGFVIGATQSQSSPADPNAAAVPTATALPTTNTSTTTLAGAPGTTLAGQPQYGLASSGSLGVQTMSGASAATRGLNVPGASVLSGGTAVPGASALTGANGAPEVGAMSMIGRAGPGSSTLGEVAPVGAGGRGGDNHRESNAWRELTEDEDIWSADDIPDTNDGVLA
jgi:hypothetical protein